MGRKEHLGWLGVLTIISGLLTFISALFLSIMDFDQVSQGFFIFSLIDLIGSALVFFAVFGVFLSHPSSDGWFNKFSFIFGIIGASFMIGVTWFFTIVIPFLYKNAPKLIDNVDPGPPLGDWMFISFLLFAISLILIGIQIIKGKSLSVLIGIGFILSPIVDMFFHESTLQIGNLLFSLTLIYLGVNLYRKGKVSKK